EPWHYSFAPLSEKFLSSYLEKHLIEKVAKDSTLLGSKYLSKTFLNNYLNENIKGVSHRVRQ
ncbi:MAG: D-alanyl-D-alanine carboxypeptidase family protein, partial [Flavobacteriaceae bacterium]|nr:D-alanyl-D-alanine carboxypeptidase family protein [Flavobacteriaceae bacterium]